MAKGVARNHDPKKWQAKFLKRLAETGHVGHAAEYAHVSGKTAYEHKKHNPEFAAAWEEALEVAVQTVMEPEAWRRAIDGTDKGVYHNGELVATEKEYSNTLLIFLMKAHMPAKYREQLDITSGGKALKAFVGFSPDEWEAQKPDDDGAKQG